MNYLIRLLAWRYLRKSADSSTSSAMTSICFLSMLIGAFALTLVSAIMNGFEHSMHAKMQGIHANIIISGSGQHLNVAAIQQRATQLCPQIKASTPSTTEHAIIQSPTSGTPQATILKAIDPIQEESVTELSTTIIESLGDTKNLAKLLQNNQIIMGSELAKQLEVNVGDTVELLYADSTIAPQSRTIKLSTDSATISALFKTGIDECDSVLIITSFDFLERLFPESGPTQLNVKLHHTNNYTNNYFENYFSSEKKIEKKVIETLKKELSLEIFSWQQLYPAIMSALTLERYAMLFILILIILVASMNIISLLFMQITQKRANIALLKTMGVPDKDIEKIFIAMGMGITIGATVTGISLAAFTSYLLNQYQLIKLPDAYYIAYLPAHLDWYMIMIIFIIIMAVSFASIKLATYKTRSINIAHVLRFEG